MLTAAVAVLVALIPGGLLGFLVPRGPYRWALWSAAPVLTLGLIAVALAWLPVVGLPNGPIAVLVTELALAALAVVGGRLWSGWRPWSKRSSGSGRGESDGPWWPARADLVALTVPAVVTLAFGWLVLGRFTFPAGWDAMNHLVLTRNILDTGSTSISSACSTGFIERVVACHFYPLGADVALAQAVDLSGGRVSAAMTAWSTVVGPLALVAAVYAALRAMRCGPVVAGCAAALPAVLGSLWAQQLDGRITGAIPAFGVSIALLFMLAVRQRQAVRLGALAGLAAAGLAMTHTYDLLFAATLTLAVLLTFRDRFRIRSAAWAFVAAAVTALLTLAPLATALLNASGERTSRKALFAGHLSDALRFWITDLRRYVLFGSPPAGSRQPFPNITTLHIALLLTVPCLVASPLCFVFARLRWGRPWLAVGAAWTAIGIWTTVSTSRPAVSLAHLWYGNPQRLRDMIFIVYPIVTVVGACAIGTVLQLLLAGGGRRAGRGARARGRLLPGLVALAVVIPLLSLAALPTSRKPLRERLDRLSPTSPSYPRVFAWLADHTPRGDVVAYNRNVEFMPWMLDGGGVHALFGIPALEPSSKPNYAERWLAWRWLVNQPSAPKGCLVRKLGIAYVVVGAKKAPGFYRGINLHPRIASSPFLDEVHRDGGIQVYQVNAAGRACTGTG